MELLRELIRIQHTQGCLDDATLREVAVRRSVPLYRLEELVSFYPHFRRVPPPRRSVQVCRDVVCMLAGGAGCRAQLLERLAGRSDVEVQAVSCLGRCDAAPAVAIDDRPNSPGTLAELDALWPLIDGEARPADPPALTERLWHCDPGRNGDPPYAAARSLAGDQPSMSSRVLPMLDDSGLRGMGGAGFPTARKWALVASEPRQPKYVICNADESEPGTFKDRVILYELPHVVIEGLLLAGLTVGAEKGIVYLRHEYGPEGAVLESALAQARTEGILGSNAAGSGRPFDVEIFISPGGYILGEETALLEALEDRRGEPRNKPPYPGQVGLCGQPTLIQNVETLALAAAILHRGTDWWHRQGRPGFSGLKFVSVCGDVARPGVHEVPMGTPIRELIERAGGMRDGRPLKAFLPGGASSHFLPASAADTPLDFAALQAAGSILGSGGLIVVGEGRALLPLATNLVRFFANESCGKCVPCRTGTAKAVALLDAVQSGQLGPQELSWLYPLADTLTQTSICGLGQVALNPILSLMKHFPQEVPAHARR